MVLPVLDYCDAVWADVDKETMRRLKDYKDEQRGLSTSKLPQNYQLIKLEPLYYTRRTHILRLLMSALQIQFLEEGIILLM